MEVASNVSPAVESPSIQPAESAASVGVPVTTSKTAMVADIVRSFGKAGVSAKEVDKVLTDRKIERSNNLVYTALSYLVTQKKLKRQDGQYFSIETVGKPAKRKMSPEGLQRIKDALKKRWAAKRVEAAKAASGANPADGS